MTGYTIKLPGDYAVIAGSPNEIDIRPTNKTLDSQTPYIPEKVVEVAFDDRYVLAKRFQVIVDKKDREYEKTVNENKPSYYILDTLIPVVYGPYNLEQFNNKKRNLKISDKLSLKSVNEYKKIK
jgi:hypothetical protein